MHRFPSAAACLLVLLPACKIERTPSEFYSHNDEAAVEREAGEAELRARVGAFREALARGQADDAVRALGPSARASVLGPGEHTGTPRQGPAGIAQAIAEIAPGGGRVMETPDLFVDVSVRQNMGWFATHLVPAPGAEQDSTAVPMRMSGVFEREKGEWRLVQVHVSPAVLPAPPAPVDSAATDSAAAAPDSAKSGS